MTLEKTRPGRTRPGAARPVLFLLLALAAAAACDDGAAVDEVAAGNAAGVSRGPDGSGAAEGDWDAPPLRRSVALSDDELAERALTLMGSAAVGASGSCGNCHAIARPTLTRWARLTADFTRACLDETASPGSELRDTAAVDSMFECFRAHAEPATTFAAGQFGIYAAAAHLPWFELVFERASIGGDAEHADFVTRVGMPRAGTRWSQQQFDEVAEWFARGLPQLFERVPEDSGDDCAPGLAPALGVHIEEMAERGWRARNEEVPLLMLGCRDGESGAACLSDRERPSDALGERWEADDGSVIRLLYDNTETRSTYWSRTSPDGRYFASGRLERGPDGLSGQFVDLARDTPIGADFSYDPTFFPDNSGFLIQRGGGNGNSSASGATDGAADPGDVAVVCEQSVLSDVATELSGEEAQCIQLDSQIGLYQQLAKSLDGDDYWVVFGSYDGDNGGFEPVLSNPAAAFESRSTTTLVPMLNVGSTFEAGVPDRIDTPQQGDPMLSPSGRLLVTRVKGAEYRTVVDGEDVVSAEQSGYALHLVSTERQGEDYDMRLTDVGRICLQGGKAAVSYDERWMVIHHYVTAADAEDLGFSDASDPRFLDYLEQGASNLLLVDLLDGSSRRITDMGAGRYALFPHFRSDGWIYFVVRTLDGQEFFAASDAALVLEGADGG
jgi:hypothetical protein